MFRPTFLSVALVLAQLVSAHEHVLHRRYSDNWALPDNHTAHALFKRGSGNDGATYPAVGSDEWRSKYPTAGTTPDKSKTPKEWLDALAAAVAAGKIPNIPPTAAAGSPDKPENPKYPQGTDPTSPQICSSTYQCRSSNDGIIYDGADSVFALNFDDGPLQATPTLVDFLKKENQIATHFMIGGNILNNPDQFKAVFEYGGDCAVHTWSHPYMTSLSNEDILAELGWTSQIIHDSTGGRLPKFWRPPTGDSDVRVRAIAKEIFGLITVIWNQDSADWSMSTGGQTMDGIAKDYDQWLSGDKKNGIVALEHELTPDTVKAFMDNYPKIQTHGWKINSLARVVGADHPYLNVDGDNVTPAKVYDGGKPASSGSGSGNGNNSSASSSTPSGSTSASASKTSSSSPSSSANSANAGAGTGTKGNNSSGLNASPVSRVAVVALLLPFLFVLSLS